MNENIRENDLLISCF